MIDQLLDKVFTEGGIWCCLCVYMIVYTNKKYSALERDVRTTLKDTLDKNTETLIKIMEGRPYADKNKR